MESEINSGSTGGGFGDGPPRLTQKEHNSLNAIDTGNEQGRHSTSTETDFAEGGSQSLVGMKRCRENEGPPRAGDADNNDEAGPETNIDEETILWNDIRLRFGTLVYTLKQVDSVLDTVEAADLVEAYAMIEDIAELQDMIKKFENADIDDEETNTLLREARDALEKLVTSLNMADV